MKFIRLVAGRQSIARAALAAGALLVTPALALSADSFPFDQELLLDAAPMRPGKRMPVLTVAPDGNATIDLWCRTVPARVQVSDNAIRVEPGPLPAALPQYMSEGQCTPERMQADEAMLAALAQVTEWRKQGSAVILAGPTTLKFRPSDH